MIRILAIRLFLFVLPFAVYALYLLLPQVRAATQTRRHPWMPLAITGLVLMALSFLVWGLTEGEPTSGVYVAPHVVNGRVVPGHVEKAP